MGTSKYPAYWICSDTAFTWRKIPGKIVLRAHGSLLWDFLSRSLRESLWTQITLHSHIRFYKIGHHITKVVCLTIPHPTPPHPKKLMGIHSDFESYTVALPYNWGKSTGKPQSGWGNGNHNNLCYMGENKFWKYPIQAPIALIPALFFVQYFQTLARRVAHPVAHSRPVTSRLKLYAHCPNVAFPSFAVDNGP
jgi:hypothetical protein